MLKNPELRQRYGPALRSTGIGGIALLASKRHRRQQTQSALPDSHFAPRINWQRGAEGTTRPIVGNSLESPAMCLGDRGADGQTHPDALRLCRVERLKNSAQMYGASQTDMPAAGAPQQSCRFADRRFAESSRTQITVTLPLSW